MKPTERESLGVGPRAIKRFTQGSSSGIGMRVLMIVLS